ncbi:hypothetical protein LUZ60_017484 [Juncus effusus]|nr:hypothetical protein LUZ60_017484 [Juncus effusus]
MGGCGSSMFKNKRETTTVYGEGVSTNEKFTYGYASTQGYRKVMEDYFESKVLETYDGELIGYFAVYDGHGGKDAAVYLKENLFDNISCHHNFLHDTQNALVEGYRKTDMELMQSSIGKDGSTAATAVLFGNRLVVGNVGDTRIVICRTDNNGTTTVTALTRDHKPSLLDERQRIETAGGTVISGRINGLALSRAFGDRHLKHFVPAIPDTQEVEVDDTLKWIIVASDGLWDVITNERAKEIVSKEDNARIAASMLMSEALTRLSLDNITCVVVRFN